MSSLTYKIIDAIEDLSGGSSSTGSGSNGAQYIKYKNPGLSTPPVYQVVCKNEQGAFFEGYIYYNDMMLHVDITVHKDNIAFGSVGFVKLDTLNQVQAVPKIITYNGQQYFAMKYNAIEPEEVVSNDYYLQKVLCSNANDVIEIANTEGVTENSDPTFKLETDASQA